MASRMSFRFAMPWYPHVQITIAERRLIGRLGSTGGELLFDERVASGEDALHALARFTGEAASRVRKATVEVTLNDELVRLFSVVPPQGVRQLGELNLACAVRFKRLFGEPTDDWCIDAVLHHRREFLAAAAPRPLIEGIVRTLGEVGWRASSIAPTFTRLVQSASRRLRDDMWLVATSGDEARVLARTRVGDRFRRTRASPTIWEEPELLAQWLGREALTLEVAPPVAILISPEGGEVSPLRAITVGSPTTQASGEGQVQLIGTPAESRQ